MAFLCVLLVLFTVYWQGAAIRAAADLLTRYALSFAFYSVLAFGVPGTKALTFTTC